MEEGGAGGGGGGGAKSGAAPLPINLVTFASGNRALKNSLSSLFMWQMFKGKGRLYSL